MKSKRKRVLPDVVIIRPITSRPMSFRCPFCNSPVAACFIASRYEPPFQQKGVYWASRQQVAPGGCPKCKATFSFKMRVSADESCTEIRLREAPVEVR